MALVDEVSSVDVDLYYEHDFVCFVCCCLCLCRIACARYMFMLVLRFGTRTLAALFIYANIVHNSYEKGLTSRGGPSNNCISQILVLRTNVYCCVRQPNTRGSMCLGCLMLISSDQVLSYIICVLLFCPLGCVSAFRMMLSDD